MLEDFKEYVKDILLSLHHLRHIAGEEAELKPKIISLYKSLNKKQIINYIIYFFNCFTSTDSLYG